MTTRAADDFEAIRARRDELRQGQKEPAKDYSFLDLTVSIAGPNGEPMLLFGGTAAAGEITANEPTVSPEEAAAAEAFFAPFAHDAVPQWFTASAGTCSISEAGAAPVTLAEINRQMADAAQRRLGETDAEFRDRLIATASAEIVQGHLYPVAVAKELMDLAESGGFCGIIAPIDDENSISEFLDDLDGSQEWNKIPVRPVLLSDEFVRICGDLYPLYVWECTLRAYDQADLRAQHAIMRSDLNDHIAVLDADGKNSVYMSQVLRTPVTVSQDGWSATYYWRIGSAPKPKHE